MDQPARFRTLFVADQSEESDVRGRIEASLRGAEAWRVESVRSRPVAASERALAQRLLTGPRLTRPITPRRTAG